MAEVVGAQAKEKRVGVMIDWRLQSWVVREAEIGHATGFSENMGSGRKKER